MHCGIKCKNDGRKHGRCIMHITQERLDSIRSDMRIEHVLFHWTQSFLFTRLFLSLLCVSVCVRVSVCRVLQVSNSSFVLLFHQWLSSTTNVSLWTFDKMIWLQYVDCLRHTSYSAVPFPVCYFEILPCSLIFNTVSPFQYITGTLGKRSNWNIIKKDMAFKSREIRQHLA